MYLEQNLINKSVFQKYLFYQLKKTNLIAKKNSSFLNTNNNSNVNNTNHKIIDDTNASPTSFDFFTNTFNISYTKVFTGWHEQTVNSQAIAIISDYIIYRDEIIGKCENSTLYKAKKISTEEICVNK